MGSCCLRGSSSCGFYWTLWLQFSSYQNVSVFDAVTSWLKRFGASLLWCVFAAAIGLLQFWCMLVFAGLDQNSVVDPERVVRDCGLLFFSTTLAATFGLDFAMHTRQTRTVIADWMLFFIFPGIIVVASVLTYSVCYYGNIKFGATLVTQIAIAVAAFVYAVVVKLRHFKKRF